MRWAFVILAACTACSSTRWPSGRKYELAETPELISRRGRIVHDKATQQLSMPWIGARVPAGWLRIESARFVIWHDDNGDKLLQERETLLSRACTERVEKVMFHDLQVAFAPDLQARLTLQLGRDELGANEQVFDFAFERD